MDNILLIVGIYWISVIGITYYVIHRKQKGHKFFSEKKTDTKKIVTFLVVAMTANTITWQKTMVVSAKY